VTYLRTSDLKRRAGQILDAAAVSPLFVTRKGALFVLAKVAAEDALPATAEAAT
jgi:hypothetical protein